MSKKTAKNFEKSMEKQNDDEKSITTVDQTIMDESDDEQKQKATKLDPKFREVVQKYLHIDDSIKQHQDVIKQLKKSAQEHQTYLLQYLQNLGMEQINVNEKNSLQVKTSKTKKSIKNEIIQQAIKQSSIKINEQQVQSLLKLIDDQRETNSSTKLVRKKK